MAIAGLQGILRNWGSADIVKSLPWLKAMSRKGVERAGFRRAAERDSYLAQRNPKFGVF